MKILQEQGISIIDILYNFQINQSLIELLKNCRAFQPEILKTKIYEKMIRDIVAISSSKEHNIVARYGLGILSNALRARRGGGDRTRDDQI